MTDAAKALARAHLKKGKPKKDKKAKKEKPPKEKKAKQPGPPGSVWAAIAIAIFTAIAIAAAGYAPELIPISAGSIAGIAAFLLAITAATAWSSEAKANRALRAELAGKADAEAARIEQAASEHHGQVLDEIDRLVPQIEQAHQQQEQLAARFDKMESWIQEHALPMVQDPEKALEAIINKQQTAVERVRRDLEEHQEEQEKIIEEVKGAVEAKPWKNDVENASQTIKAEIQKIAEDAARVINEGREMVATLEDSLDERFDDFGGRLTEDQLEQVELIVRRLMDGHVIARSLGDAPSRPNARAKRPSTAKKAAKATAKK